MPPAQGRITPCTFKCTKLVLLPKGLRSSYPTRHVQSTNFRRHRNRNETVITESRGDGSHSHLQLPPPPPPLPSPKGPYALMLLIPPPRHLHWGSPPQYPFPPRCPLLRPQLASSVDSLRRRGDAPLPHPPEDQIWSFPARRVFQ